MQKYSIVFPIFNGLEFTQKCLKSLFKDIDLGIQDIKFSVVVVDDGSTDNSSAWIKINFPQVHLLKGDGNLWWSGGINMGIKYAIEELNSDYIIWWNNDIISDKMYFHNLIRILEDNSSNKIIGSKIYLINQKNIIWSMGGMFDPKTGRKSVVGCEMPDGDDFQNEIEVDWLPGMGTVTHQSVYKKIGMLDDKNFPQYHGDSDFTFRAKQNGYKIVVNPELKIYNDNSHSGVVHQESFKGLVNSLFSTQSNYNLTKDFKFYNRYASSFKAYFFLFNRYLRYIGGFFKWKLFGIFGVNK